MRATSESLVTAPPGAALTTMSPNSCSVVSRPLALIGSSKSAPVGEGEAPITPAATSAFCSRIALTMSLAERLRAATLSGSSQMRIA